MLLNLDRELFFLLNGSDSLILDNVWWTVSQTWTWLVFYAVLLFVILRRSGGWQTALAVVLAIALCVFLSDRISSGIFKPLFERWRPSRDPVIGPLVDIVNGYRGGRYGFCSSHAANTFGLATLLTLMLTSRFRRNAHHPVQTLPLSSTSSQGKGFRWGLLCFFIILWGWALANSYSRIYLGVHYPGDVLCGALVGVFSAWVCWWLLLWADGRWGVRVRLMRFSSADFYWLAGSVIASFLVGLVVNSF